MAVTVSILENINLSGLYYTQDNFAFAGSWFADADTTFGDQAKKPVESGAAWTGTGQADAITVLEINRSAMEIGGFQMEAASNTVEGLQAAMRSARDKIAAVKAEAAQRHLVVNDTGTVTGDPNAPYDTGGESIETARRLSREVQGALLFAAAADANTAALLGQIGAHTPTYSDIADPGALHHNSATLEAALADYDTSFGFRDFWQAARPQALPEPEDPIWAWLGNNGQAILDFVAGVALVGLGGSLTGVGLTGGFASTVVAVTGVGTVVGVPGVALSATAVAAGLGTVAYGTSLVDEALSRMDSAGGGSSNGPPPRYKPGDNIRQTRTYGKSTSDVKGQATRYADKMKANKNYRVDVPNVRYTKYGRADVTVTVRRYDPKTHQWVIQHIRHFLSKTRG